MWLATRDMGADLSKSFSKKVLEIVLDTEILALSEISVFGKGKTPKALEFAGFSAFSIVWYFRLFCVNVGFVKKSWKPFGSNPTGVRIPLPPPRKTSVELFQLRFFFIHCESNGISSRFSVYIIAVGAYHQPQVVSLSQWWYTATSCGWYAKLRFDDIQGYALICLHKCGIILKSEVLLCRKISVL